MRGREPSRVDHNAAFHQLMACQGPPAGGLPTRSDLLQRDRTVISEPRIPPVSPIRRHSAPWGSGARLGRGHRRKHVHWPGPRPPPATGLAPYCHRRRQGLSARRGPRPGRRPGRPFRLTCASGSLRAGLPTQGHAADRGTEIATCRINSCRSNPGLKQGTPYRIRKSDKEIPCCDIP